MFKVWIWSSLLLGQAALGQSDGTSASNQDESTPDLTVYDASAATPTLLEDQVMVFLDESGVRDATTTEDVMVMPTPMAEGSTTITTVTGTKTTTVVVPNSADPVSIPSGLISPYFGPGPVIPPPGTFPTDGASTSEDSSPSKSSNGSTLGDMKQSGISYAPYKADGSCKSQDDIDNDFDRFASHYGYVRVYGTDCDQVTKVHKAAKRHDVKLFLGIWDLDKVQDEGNQIISSIGDDWDRVHTVSVGNELVNNGQASPGQVVAAVKQARPLLRAAGYKGPVVAVDTFMAVGNHPELCDESDYCAVNAHPFFDATVSAEQAGPWLQKTISHIQKITSHSRPVVISETGWPTEGMSNGLAVPGIANQKTALASIKEAFKESPGQLVLFSAFNDLWKTKEAATFNADQYWGIDGAISHSDN